jgi:AcrR family transcriptional regulator
MPEEHPLEIFWRSQKALLRDLFDGRLGLQTAAERLTAIVIPEPALDRVDDDDDDEGDKMADIEAMWRIILGILEDAPERVRLFTISSCASRSFHLLSLNRDNSCAGMSLDSAFGRMRRG